MCWVLYRPNGHLREGFLPGDLEQSDEKEQKRGTASFQFALNRMFAGPKLSLDPPILHFALKGFFQAMGMKQSGLSRK